MLRRVQNIPSTQKGKREETKRVKAVLRDNNYPSSFISSCERSLSKLPTDLPSNGFVVLPHVQGISERIGGIKVAVKPLRTVNSLFPRPNAQEKFDRHNLTQCTKSAASTAADTTVKLNDCEHKKAVSMFGHNSKISCHVHENTTKWILQMSELLDMRLTISSDFSWKPGFQYRIRNLGMITSPSHAEVYKTLAYT